MVFQILYFSGNLLTAYSKFEVYVMFSCEQSLSKPQIAKLGKLYAVLY
jgi:hypothetical protein